MRNSKDDICECGHDKIRHGGLLKQMRITNKHTPCWDCPCKKFTPRKEKKEDVLEKK
jgi:hypothetical protein